MASVTSHRAPSWCIEVNNLHEFATAGVVRGVLLTKAISPKTIIIEEMAASPGHYTAKIELMNDSDARKAVMALDEKLIFGETVSARHCYNGSQSGKRKQAAATPIAANFKHFESPPVLPSKTLSPSIKVTGFASSITEATLRQYFSRAGQILSCKLMEKPNSSKPYAYINFGNAICAEKAVKTLHMSQLEGNIIKVKHQGAETVNGTAIKVTQLSLKVTESDLMTHCLQFGNILSVKVINTQPPHAFVTFSNPVEASNAAMSLNHHQFMETMIKVTVVAQQGKLLLFLTSQLIF